jgi:outer membrane protein assembly factor BamB
VANDVVYTGSGNLDKNLDNGALQAWQPATGKKLWSYAPPDSQGGLSGVSSSRVYYNANGYLYSLGA